MTGLTPTKGKQEEELGLPLNVAVSVAMIPSHFVCLRPLLVKFDESPPSQIISTTTIDVVCEKGFCVRTELTGVTLCNNVGKLYQKPYLLFFLKQ